MKNKFKEKLPFLVKIGGRWGKSSIWAHWPKHLCFGRKLGGEMFLFVIQLVLKWHVVPPRGCGLRIQILLLSHSLFYPNLSHLIPLIQPSEVGIVLSHLETEQLRFREAEELGICTTRVYTLIGLSTWTVCAPMLCLFSHLPTKLSRDPDWGRLNRWNIIL